MASLINLRPVAILCRASVDLRPVGCRCVVVDIGIETRPMADMIGRTGDVFEDFPKGVECGNSEKFPQILRRQKGRGAPSFSVFVIRDSQAVQNDVQSVRNVTKNAENRSGSLLMFSGTFLVSFSGFRDCGKLANFNHIHTMRVVETLRDLGRPPYMNRADG